MIEELIEPKRVRAIQEALPERVRAIQEALCGFLLDEIINPIGEFYANHSISVGLAVKTGTTMMTCNI